MASKKDDIRAKVEARKRAEEASRAAKKNLAEIRKLEISDEDLLGYLNENRVGDAKLYCRLHRGKVVFVKFWNRFLIWGGHHWIEDDYDFA